MPLKDAWIITAQNWKNYLCEEKDQFTNALLGHVSSRPEWTRVLRAQEQAFELMKFTPESQRAPMLCLIGWLEWLKGQSSFAARYFRLAIDDVEDFRMAVLLAELVNKGMVAEVARNKDTAYRHLRGI